MPNATQGTTQGQQLTNTLALPLSRGGNQAVMNQLYKSLCTRQQPMSLLKSQSRYHLSLGKGFVALS